MPKKRVIVVAPGRASYTRDSSNYLKNSSEKRFINLINDINKKVEQFFEFIFKSMKRFFADTMIKNKVFDREVGQDTLIVVQLFIILLIFIFVWKIYL